MKKLIYFVILVAASFGIVFIAVQNNDSVFSLFYKKTEVKRDVQVVANKPATTTKAFVPDKAPGTITKLDANWNNYKNEELGYSIDYPTSWSHDYDQPYDSFENGDERTIGCRVGPAEQPIPPAGFYKQLFNSKVGQKLSTQAMSQGESFDMEYTKQAELTIWNYSAVKVLVTNSTYNDDRTTIYYLVKVGNDYFSLFTCFSSKLVGDDAAILDRMARSIKSYTKVDEENNKCITQEQKLRFIMHDGINCYAPGENSPYTD
jgi:hypothetical protein